MRVVVVGDGRSERLASIPFAVQFEGKAGDAPDRGASFGPRRGDVHVRLVGAREGVVLSDGQHDANGYHPAALFDIGRGDNVDVLLVLCINMAQGYGVCVARVGCRGSDHAPV